MQHARGIAFFGGSLFLSIIFLAFNPSILFAQQDSADSNRPPVVKPIHANLIPPTTTFTVEATDPDGDPLKYIWEGDTSCGLFHGSSGPSATWSHPEGGPPFGCRHSDGTSHEGMIYLHIDDGHHSVLCSYEGSENGDGPDCLQDAPEYYPGIFQDWEDFVYEYCYYFLLPIIALILGGGWWLYNNGLFVGRKEEEDPCAELRKQEEAARAKYEAARESFNTIDSAKKAADDAANAAKAARGAADAAARAAGGRWSAHGSTDWEGEHIEVHKEGWQNKDLGKKADDAAKAANDAADAAKKAKTDFNGQGGVSGWQNARDARDQAESGWQKAASALKVCIGGIGAPKPEPKDPPPPPTTPTGPVVDGGTAGGGTVPPPTTPPEQPKKHEPPFVCYEGAKRNERSEHIDVAILDLPSVVLKQDKIYSDAGNEAMKFIDYLQTIKGVFMMGKNMKGGAEAYLEKSITGAADAVDFPDFLTFYDKGIDLLTKSMHELFVIMQDKQALGDYWLEFRIKKLSLNCARWEECENNRWVSHCALTIVDNGFETHTTEPEMVIEAREVQHVITRLFTKLRNRYNGDKTRAKQFTTSCQ